jgi:hypothetical protein
VNKFISVKIRERVEGTPGFIEAREFDVTINPDNITLFNSGEDPSVTFVRLACGGTLCVCMPVKEFKKLLEKE